MNSFLVLSWDDANETNLRRGIVGPLVVISLLVHRWSKALGTGSGRVNLFKGSIIIVKSQLYMNWYLTYPQIHVLICVKALSLRLALLPDSQPNHEKGGSR
jgi:hypothetical protein